MIADFSLYPTRVETVPPENILAQKLLVLRDGYVAKNTELAEQLYDAYKLFLFVQPGADFRDRFESFLDGYSPNCGDTLSFEDVRKDISRMLLFDCLKRDFNRRVKMFLFEDVSYETVKETLQAELSRANCNP